MMNIEKALVVLGLQYGDEGKGKISAGLAKTNLFDCSARYNGGPNAGHTVNLTNGKQLKLHQIPASIIYKIPGHIGAGCAVNFTLLDREAQEFKKVMGFCPYDFLTISPRATLIGSGHIKEDKNEHAITQGSTGSGIAPAYASFYNRSARLTNSYTWPDSNGRECIQDLPNAQNLLLEGAQGFYLDPHLGNYPYTTSSSSHPGYAASTIGFPVNKIKEIVGVAKCYETRSGIDPYFDKILTQDGYITPKFSSYTQSFIDRTYSQLQDLGNEVGVTTGRQRKIRFLDMNRLINSINATGTTIVVINKWDILEQLGSEAQRYFYKREFRNPGWNMPAEVSTIIYNECPSVRQVIHSNSPTNDVNWRYHLDSKIRQF
jgi:adenylosuccinate synthase